MSTARFNTLENAAGTKSVPVATVVDGSAKAWVNFNGTGTVAIRASFNVTSITDNGVGNYTVNFTSAMPNVNYAVVATMGKGDINAKASALDTSFTTTSVQILTGVSSGTIHTQLEDAPYCGVAIFR